MQEAPQETPRPSAPESRALVTIAIRATGVVFVSLGVAAGFDIAGFGSQLMGFDAITTKIFGGTLAAVGIFDILVLPRLLHAKDDRTL